MNCISFQNNLFLKTSPNSEVYCVIPFDFFAKIDFFVLTSRLVSKLIENHRGGIFPTLLGTFWDTGVTGPRLNVPKNEFFQKRSYCISIERKFYPLFKYV